METFPSFVFRDARRGDELAVKAVVANVLREFGWEPDMRGLDSDLDDLVANYIARGGVFRVLVGDDGAIVGCGGLYPLPNGEVELRKMHFYPIARGRGLGKQLVRDLIAFARKAGYRRIVLETSSKLTTAGRIYRSFGFVETTSDHLATRADQALALDLTTPSQEPSLT
jgi:putative acetyltransferase